MITENADAPKEENSLEEQTPEEFLALARKRFELVSDAENSFRVEAIDDAKFLKGDQWDPKVKQQRESDGRPCLTINRLIQSSRQVTNDSRQNRPSIKVSPVDDEADPGTAKVIQGLIKHIQNSSNADVAYDRAIENTVQKGKGYMRVYTKYCNPKSFNLDIVIGSVRNIFSVYLDPYHTEPDGSDAQWGFITEDMSHDEYRSRYKDFPIGDLESWRGLGDEKYNWIDEKSIRVLEYFYIEYKTEKIALTYDGETYTVKELEETLGANLSELQAKGFVKKVRESQVPQVKWATMTAKDKIDEKDWPGKYIPIIKTIGDEIDIDGEVTYSGIVRHAKDPARISNYMASAETETIALAPRTPWILAEGQDEGYEDEWDTAHSKNHSRLRYRPISVNGVPMPPPQRGNYEPATAAITNARMQASEDIKATTGIYDAAVGAQSNETSGRAITARTRQAQTSNFHYSDNFARSLKYLGRIIVDLIPHVYDSERIIRIIGDNDKEEQLWIHREIQHNKETKIYDFSVGEYDVAISAGPSYATKRQEAVEAMLDFIQAFPQAAPLIGDLLAKMMDWPEHEEVSKRLKALLPPELKGDGDEKQQPLPPEAVQEFQKLNQMVEGLTQQLNAAHEEMRTKKMELDSKERIEMAKIERDYHIALLDHDAEDNRVAFKANIDQINRQQENLGMTKELPAGGGEVPAVPAENINPTGGQSPGQIME